MLQQIQFNPEVRSLQKFLDEHGFYLPFNIESYIDPGDIIEVYSEDCVQIYRNSALEKLCSYDRETLETQPFDVLFKRDLEITEALIERTKECLGGPKEVSAINVAPHYMQEKYAKNSRVFYIEEKWCSPLLSKKTDNVMGFFASQQARLVGESNIAGLGNSYFGTDDA